MLSVGDISGDGVCRRRLETLNCMFGMYPEGAGSSAAKEIFDRACKDLETIRQRLMPVNRYAYGTAATRMRCADYTGF